MMRSPASVPPRSIVAKEILLSERGLVQLVVQELRPNVRVTKLKGDSVYCWHPEEKLWKMSSQISILEQCYTYLQQVVFAAYQVERDEDVMDQLEDLLKRIETAKFIRILWKEVKERLLDLDFESILNKQWPHCLAIAGGQLIDLRNLSTRERTREDYCSFECRVRLLPYQFHPLSNAVAFFSSIMCGDVEMLSTLQKICGYLLSGEKRSRCFFLFWGPQGSNGKSTLIELLRLILLEPYFTVLSSDVTFSGARRASIGSHTAHLMPLEHSRVGVYSESKAGDTLNDGIIKIITSETGAISARAAYGREQREIHSCAKLILETNHLIRFDAMDQAMLDRIIVLPFLARFTLENGARNSEFITRLKTIHLDEIFTWMAIGAARWYAEGPTFKCSTRMQYYRQELIQLQDYIAYFIASNFILHAPEDRDHRMSKREVIERFLDWCKGKHIIATEKDIKRLLGCLPLCRKPRKLRNGPPRPPDEDHYACSLKEEVELCEEFKEKLAVTKKEE